MSEHTQSTSNEPTESRPTSTPSSKSYKAAGVRCAVELQVAPDGWRWITVTLPAEFGVYFAGIATDYWGTQETLSISFNEPSTTLDARPHMRQSVNG